METNGSTASQRIERQQDALELRAYLHAFAFQLVHPTTQGRNLLPRMRQPPVKNGDVVVCRESLASISYTLAGYRDSLWPHGHAPTEL